MNITGTLIVCKHWSKSAIGVVNVKKPRHEKHAKHLQNVEIPKSKEDWVTTIPHSPVSYMTFPLPKKKIRKTQVTTANIIGIVRNLIYDLMEILATPKTKMLIRENTIMSNVKLLIINVATMIAMDTITLRYTLVSVSLLLWAM